MDLREEKIEIRGETYTVRELSARQIIPLMDSLRDSDGEFQQSEYSIKIFEAACSHDGVPLQVDNIGGSVYLSLMPVAMRLNGVSSPEKD